MFSFGEADAITGPNPSERAFREFEDDDLGAALVDSESAGQETAPITGPASTEPLDGRFQTCFLPWEAAARSPLLSGVSAGAAAFSGERSDGSGGRTDGGGEKGPAWDHGEEGWPRAAARPERGEWMLGGGSEASDMDDGGLGIVLLR